MQKWKVDDDAVAWTAEDGDWVPAEVAQGLYEVLKAMVDYADDVDPCFPGLGKARAALAAADGEEV